jgi:Replication-relaxation
MVELEVTMTRYVTAAVARDLDVQLTERDRAVLRSVLELRFVSGDQLARMHFAGHEPRAVRRALLRLTRLDVLERLPRVVGGVRAGSAGYVYRLGLAGQRLGLEHGWIPERRRRRSRVPGTLFLNHALAVSELHTLLTEVGRSGRLELLELSAEPACWRSYGGVGAQRFTLKPDSFLRLGSGDYELVFFIEVDMGSEGSRALDRQLRAYVAYYGSGKEQAERGVFPKTLWLAPDERRVSAIGECVGRLPRESRELFQVARFADAISVVSNTSNN